MKLRRFYMSLFAVAIVSLLISIALVSAETDLITGPSAQATFFPTPSPPPINYEFDTYLPLIVR